MPGSLARKTQLGLKKILRSLSSLSPSLQGLSMWPFQLGHFRIAEILTFSWGLDAHVPRGQRAEERSFVFCALASEVTQGHSHHSSRPTQIPKEQTGPHLLVESMSYYKKNIWIEMYWYGHLWKYNRPYFVGYLWRLNEKYFKRLHDKNKISNWRPEWAEWPLRRTVWMRNKSRVTSGKY